MIVILTGHGGKDKGASSSGIYENDINYKIAKNAINVISENTKKFIWLNKENKYMDIPTRGRELKILGEKYGKLDVYCVHCDWNHNVNVKGISIIKSVWNTENEKIYYDFMKNYSEEFNINYRNVWSRKYKDGSAKIDHYGVHRLSGENAIVKIVEFGFISNRNDRNILVKKADEIGKFFGYFVLRKNKIKVKSNVLYKVQCGAFSNLENAKKLKSSLEKKGFESIIKKEG